MCSNPTLSVYNNFFYIEEIYISEQIISLSGPSLFDDEHGFEIQIKDRDV